METVKEVAVIIHRISSGEVLGVKPDEKSGWQFPRIKVTTTVTSNETLKQLVKNQLGEKITLQNYYRTIEDTDYFICTISGNLNKKVLVSATWFKSENLHSSKWISQDQQLFNEIEKCLYHPYLLPLITEDIKEATSTIDIFKALPYARQTAKPANIKYVDDTCSSQRTLGGVYALWAEINRTKFMKLYCKPPKNHPYKLYTLPNTEICITEDNCNNLPDSNYWICLQVAQTKNMASEIIDNLNLMQKPSQLTTDYTNHWGVKLFEHPTHLETAGKWIYTQIMEKNILKLAFAVVSYDDNESSRKNTESAYAEKFSAYYWR